MRARIVPLLLVASLVSAPVIAADPVLLHAAGSLRPALTEIGKAFEAANAIPVQAKFGASGLLKDEIAAGARAEVFASANMEHPLALAAAKRSGPVVLFARNKLCALVRSGLSVGPSDLLDVMLYPSVKLGTSTPLSDPSGDYAWEVFRKADATKPGTLAALEKKALKLTGAPNSPPGPSGRNIYGALVAEGKADIFLTYCTNARVAQRENPGQKIVALPASLAVGADYGLTVMVDASPNASRFAMFILSPEGQRILATYGFSAPTLPD